ncbi:hypothetical protein Rctr71_077 [Virus Rctr71]|nr:hypothetical protein Rctr71_077 [Virus Rctr71]
MFDRQTSNQLESLFARTGTGPQRLHRMSIGMLMLLQAIFEALGTVKSLWDNGFGAQVAAAEDNTIVNGYTKRWWQTLQAVFLVYSIAMRAPLGYLATLTDAQGNAPFAVFDPAQLEELAALSIEQITWMEAETMVQAEAGQGIDSPVE